MHRLHFACDLRPSLVTEYTLKIAKRNAFASAWRHQEGANRSRRYFPIQVVPQEIGVDSRRNHQAGVSESSSHIDSKRREPLGITHVVPVLPPFRGGNREPLVYYGT